MSKIISVATHQAAYQYKTPEIIEYMDRVWLSKIDATHRRTALHILRASEIESRGSVVPLETVFSNLGFEEKNNLYAKATVEMGRAVLEKALNQAGLKPEELDAIITVSCTGFMIPSMDAYIINDLKLRQNILRLPVTEMGCAGGTAGLIYAHQFVKAHPDWKVAVVSVETPSLTFQREDLSMENFVSTGIFADGSSCVILGGSEQSGPEIIDTNAYHFPNATYLMGYQLQNSGLKIVLDRDVPDQIQEHFPNILLPFLKKNNLAPQDIKHYLFHPGGKKIINRTEAYMQTIGKDISDSKEVLRDHGNMSSSTVIYILEKFMKKQIPKGDKGYMLAFGPGFMALSLLFEWS